MPPDSVLGKTRLILECFGADDADLSLSEIARRTGVAKASVHRLNRELVAWGMLERAGERYRLGLRAFELGGRVAHLRLLRDAARPAMERLSAALDETVHLAVLDGHDVLYVEKVVATTRATRSSRIAGRMPAHATATGKVLLAHGPPGLVESVIAHGLPRRTARTVAAPQRLRDQVARAARDGYAVEFEEVSAGYCSVAVPVPPPAGGDAVPASLSVTAPTVRADVRRFASALAAASRGIRRPGP
ncbi:IclR family transcriptional regulator [Nocardioides sp. L-11A]|uniref:IclR family transcriptional regulator n=1 Tax=Nocardioides sp. L-11A TaxID=3043848 RepID=UPI00249A6A87|nr:IclR family transcriptional regulator [Nocardioides sp. L-11A]